MATEPKTNKDLKNPGKMDFKKARKTLDRVIQENVDWLKEMAKK
jgi:hypothetical protein